MSGKVSAALCVLCLVLSYFALYGNSYRNYEVPEMVLTIEKLERDRLGLELEVRTLGLNQKAQRETVHEVMELLHDEIEALKDHEKEFGEEEKESLRNQLQSVINRLKAHHGAPKKE